MDLYFVLGGLVVVGVLFVMVLAIGPSYVSSQIGQERGDEDREQAAWLLELKRQREEEEQSDG